LSRPEEPGAAQKRSIGHAGCGKDDLFTGSEIIGVINLITVRNTHFVEPPHYHVLRRNFRFVDAQPFGVPDEPGLYLTIQAFHRGRRENALRSSADAYQSVYICSRYRRRNSCREIAVRNEPDSRT